MSISHARRAGLLLQGLQIAAKLTSRPNTAEPSESVRALYTLAGAPIDPSSDPFESETEILAPDKTVCEPPHDCINCPRRDTCENYQESDDDEQDSDDEQDEEESEDDEDDDESEGADPNDSDDEEDNGGSSSLQAAESRPTNLKGLQARALANAPPIASARPDKRREAGRSGPQAYRESGGSSSPQAAESRPTNLKGLQARALANAPQSPARPDKHRERDSPSIPPGD